MVCGGVFLSKYRDELLIVGWLGLCWFHAVVDGRCMRGEMMLER